MAAFFNFVSKGNGVIGIAYNAFTLGIQQKLFAAEGILSRALSVRPEIGGGAYIGPFYITALSEPVKQLLMCGGKRLERVGKIGSVGHGKRMLRVYKKTSRAAYNYKAFIRSR